MVERVARKIAAALGDDFDHAFASKADWTAARGESGGRFRDINEPTQSDYMDAARAAIEAMPLEAMKSAEAWLDRWGAHVGNCPGGERCTCGLTAITSEVSSACAMIDAALSPQRSEGK